MYSLLFGQTQSQPDATKIKEFKVLVSAGKIDLIKKFITDGLDPSVDDNYAIKTAVNLSNIKLIELLLTHDQVDPNCALKLACDTGLVNIVKQILNHPKVKPDISYNAIMRELMYKSVYRLNLIPDDNYFICWLMITNKNSESIVNKNILEYACVNGLTPIVSHLLETKKFDLCAGQHTLLRIAASCGYVDIVKLLLNDDRIIKSNISINQIPVYRDPINRIIRPHTIYFCKTILEDAYINGHTEIVDLLLEFILKYELKIDQTTLPMK